MKPISNSLLNLKLVKCYPFHNLGRCSIMIRRNMSNNNNIIYASGQSWTGALGTGAISMINNDGSDGQDDFFQKVNINTNQLQNENQEEVNMDIVSAAVGWGHSALIVQQQQQQQSKLMVTGRPYDFQNLLRLKRIPSFARREIVKQSLRYDDGSSSTISSSTSFFNRMVNTLFQTQQHPDTITNETGGGGESKSENSSFHHGILPIFTEIKLPNGDTPSTTTTTTDVSFSSSSQKLQYSNHHKIAASAGVTAVIGKSGKLYTFGLNNRGQCGIGKLDIHHVWEPTPIHITPTATSTSFFTKRSSKKLDTTTETCFVSVALGLQHGLGLDNNGHLFSWGKGSRGQLGVLAPDLDIRGVPIINDSNDDDDDTNIQNDLKSNIDVEYSAIPVNIFSLSDSTYHYDTENSSLLSGTDVQVTCISAGQNHSAAVTKSNHAWVWGKNVRPPQSGTTTNAKSTFTSPSSLVKDAPLPYLIKGLPSNLQILDISCGSHHTAILMEDGSVYAVGIATDGTIPIVDQAVQIIPPGLVDFPIRQFKSHFDRTTIVAGGMDSSSSRPQVLEVSLWSTEEMRRTGVFEPGWVDEIDERVKMVHRGWLHTLVVTE